MGCITAPSRNNTQKLAFKGDIWPNGPNFCVLFRSEPAPSHESRHGQRERHPEFLDSGRKMVPLIVIPHAETSIYEQAKLKAVRGISLRNPNRNALLALAGIK